ncbi:Ser-Thr-rich glycosyl-phosphatidyl-inositol-anchored membrane family-domain-containing protein [Podospora didyma]|uniref:Ser-Thr-rich glycosyl-phosphatidyl-inositol-anchored membrane family-domain-containing protein n=1 Tax=Podospora didyma TaxID=330526 RepID=A0AAE0P7C3_9PEZI|nr:Ser-Thr-rich glycosyl-phosphatidyl-inositol-anchored membrane family-domain-containing protein [Podospora didyma]
MRFSIAATLAFATTVLAQTPGFAVVSKPTKGDTVPAGKTYTIKWSPSSDFNGTLHIVLIGGPDQAGLQPVETIGSDIEENAGTYDWAVAKTLTAPLYGLQIFSDKNSSVFQYSFPFTITGGSAATSASASSSSASSSTTVSKVSSVSSTVAPASESSAAVSTTTSASSTLISSTPSGNLSMSRTTSTATTVVSTSRTGTSTTSSPTSGATAFIANSFAVVGGFAMAMLAL